MICGYSAGFAPNARFTCTIDAPCQECRDQETLPVYPKPGWIVGGCPKCGSALVRNYHRVGGKGDILVTQCWESLGSHRQPTCDYRA